MKFLKRLIAKIVNLFRRIADDFGDHAGAIGVNLKDGIKQCVKDELADAKAHAKTDAAKLKLELRDEIEDVRNDIRTLRDLAK